MNAQHTPGPWKKVEEQTTHDRTVYSVDGPPSDFMFLEKEADALLIAAAPDLLSALVVFDTWLCEHNQESQESRMRGRKVLINARAAIAKAKGEVAL